MVRHGTVFFPLTMTLFLIALLPSLGNTAPTPHVTAELSARRGTTADVFTWSIIAHDTSDVPVPTIGESPDFEVRYRGPQSSVQILNGEVHRQLRYVYHLIPRREGHLRTPHATVVAAGRTYDVAPLEVEIAPGGSASGKTEIHGVAVTQSVDRSTVFLGQQLTNTIEILTRTQLIEPQFGDLTFDGFRHLDIGDDQRSTRIVAGRPTTVITLKKALYPIRTGELVIPRRELRAKMRVQAPHRGGFPFDLSDPFGGGFFDEFFGGGALKEVSFSAEPITISVKPLPPASHQLATWGSHPPLVGHTGINIRLSSAPLAFGESRSFEVELTSEGNIAPIMTVPFENSSEYRIYQEPPETKVFDAEGTIVTRRTFKASLVPLKGGTMKLPPLQLSYFDPGAEVYKTTGSQEYVLEVVGGPRQSTTGPIPLPSPTEAPGLENQGFYEPLGIGARIGRHISLSLALLIFTAVLMIGGLIYLHHWRAERERPREVAWGAVKTAAGIEALRRNLRRALALELSLDGDSSVKELRAELARRHASPDTDFAVQTLFDALDAISYGGSGSGEALGGLRERALALRRAIPRE